MNAQQAEEPAPNWRFLWELKIAAQSVSEIYVSVSVLGGHYVRVSPKDFLETINDMQAVSVTHPHPKRFQFTMENSILWVHSSSMPKKKASLPADGNAA